MSSTRENEEYIANILSENILKLNITEEDAYVKYLKKYTANTIGQLVENGEIPIVMFVACGCGCGKVSYQINEDILSLQQGIKFLEVALDELKNKMANLN